MAAQCRTHSSPEWPPAHSKLARLPAPVSSCTPVLLSTVASASHPETYSSAPGKITPAPMTTNTHPVVHFLHLLLSPMAVATTLPSSESYSPPSDQPHHWAKPSSFPYTSPFGASPGRQTSCTQFSSPKQNSSILQGNHPTPLQQSQLIKPRPFIRIRWVGTRWWSISDMARPDCTWRTC